MKDKNGEITIKSFFKWLRSDNGKKYGFFVFYIFFFVFIFVFLAFTDKTDINNIEKNDNPPIQEESQSSLPFNLEYLEKSDYTFQYKVLVNEKEKEYLGKKKNNLITISNDTGIYTYEYKNGQLEENDELDEYYQLFDIYEIKRIVKKSKYNYKQEYNDGRVVYSYLITSGELANYLKIENTKESLDNEIQIKTNQKNEVVEINFDILNLMGNQNKLDEQDNLYKIIITYGDNNE